MQRILIRQNKLILSACSIVGASAAVIRRFHSAELSTVDPTVTGKCADAIRHMAWAAGFGLGLATHESCPDSEAVQSNQVGIHPGNPNSFDGYKISRADVRPGDLILFHNTDPRYYGTGLVSHAGLVICPERELLVDVSYTTRKVCLRAWSTFTVQQHFGFWRLSAIESGGWTQAEIQHSFSDFERRATTISRLEEGQKKDSLQAWNVHLRLVEVEKMKTIQPLSSFLEQMLDDTTMRLGCLEAYQPASLEWIDIAPPPVNSTPKLLARVMERLSLEFSRRGWHAQLRRLRALLGIGSRTQSAGKTLETWREPLSYRNFSNQLHAHWLSKLLPHQAFQNVLKTDLHDESFSSGLMPWLEERSQTVCGIDLDETTRGKAQSRHSNLLSFHTDVQTMPFPGDTFEFVLSNSTLDHQEESDEILRGLKEMERVLAPGGRVFVTLDNPENPIVSWRNSLPRFLWLEKLGIAPYFRGATLSQSSLISELEKLGLEIEHRDFLLHFPRFFLVHLVSRLPGAERLFEALLLLEDRVPKSWRRRTGYFVSVLARKPLKCGSGF